MTDRGQEHEENVPKPTSDHPTPTADDEAQKDAAKRHRAGRAAEKATEEADDNPSN
ncbi:MAG TPA: hypothetical protein VFQ71_04155 [Gaiellales bacterium]|jgi:hypothetical protein|nr:hypothetical protein [Gaiellales bacterium]